MTQQPNGISILVIRLIAVASAILIAGLVIRNTVVQIGNELRAPLGFSERVWPADGTLELIDQQLIVPQIDWNKHSVKEIAQAARRARSLDPLDEWPFVLDAMIHMQSREFESATESLLQANRRNARASIPHLLLLQAYAQRGMIDKTLNELVTFVDMWPQLADPLMPSLIASVMLEDNDYFLARVDRHPDVLMSLIKGASRTEGAESYLPRLLDRPGVTREMKLDSIQELARRDRHDLAYPLWQELMNSQVTIPYDPDFQGLEGPQPYAWKITSGSDVEADFSRRNADGDIALDVASFGTTLNRVVDQTMPIPAGRHSLRISGVAIEPQQQSSKMRWTITCERASKPLSQIEFPMLEGRQNHVLKFVIPEKGCAFQTVSLFTVPGAIRAEYRMRFDKIRLIKNSG